MILKWKDKDKIIHEVEVHSINLIGKFGEFTMRDCPDGGIPEALRVEAINRTLVVFPGGFTNIWIREEKR